MATILGIHMGHDASAALIRDGKVLIALSEERLVREKMYFGFPRRSVALCLEIGGLTPEEIDLVALDTEELPGLLGEMEIRRRFAVGATRSAFRLLDRAGRVRRYFLGSSRDPESRESIAREALLVELQRLGFDRNKVMVFDHHRCHVASACFCSPYANGFFVTSDGRGDGLSSCFGQFRGCELVTNGTISDEDSLGQFYAAVTMFLGFRPNRHEGKITGLAAYGDPKALGPKFAEMISWNGDGTYAFRLPGRFRASGSDDAVEFLRGLSLDLRDRISVELQRSAATVMYTAKWHGMLAYLEETASGHSKADVAAGVQFLVEETMQELLVRVLPSGPVPLALAGGLFANVKVNQRLLAIPSVSNIFVQPAMGDDGLSVGAALLGLLSVPDGEDNMVGPSRPSRFDDAYLGPEYSDKSIEVAAQALDCVPTPLEKPERQIAAWLHEGKIVGIHDERMEFGPRALGHRSILANPTDRDINHTLNERLQRTEFMPFAPSILAEHAAEYLEGWEPSHIASEFMTLTYDIPEHRQQEIPAVVHVDGTARPQVVHRDKEPRYWRIIDEYRKLSGVPAIVNTSFNAHEEPIVCTPEDAIRSFLAGRVDELVVGNRWIQRRGETPK